MILIGNGKLLTRDNNNTFIENGCVCVDGNIIVDLGNHRGNEEKI